MNRERTPEEQARANIYFAAFLIDLSGIIDNMAWLWICQNKTETLDFEKDRMKIGLFNKKFKKYLPTSITLLVKEYSNWYKHLISYRHPTAHRIPPYILPYTFPKEDQPDSRDYTPRYTTGLDGEFTWLHAQCLADVNTIISLLETLLTEIKSLCNKNYNASSKSGD